MDNRDMNSVIKSLPAIDPAAIMAGNATKTGATIDRQGFEALEFQVISGVLTDATYTCSVYESDASDMSGEVLVADAKLIGRANAFTFLGTTAADDSTVKQIGYIGSKRYVRIKIVQTGATTGGFICAIAILASPKIMPTTPVA
jgi:hypothetical protein